MRVGHDDISINLVKLDASDVLRDKVSFCEIFCKFLDKWAAR